MLYRWYRCLWLAAVFTAQPVFAENSIQLQWPLSCSVGQDCFIQAYPDVLAGADSERAMDYRCGSRTSPGLKATQIVFKDWNTGLADQGVYPVAAGKVVTVVSDFIDGEMQAANKACGNQVMVDHGGWESTYCHLRQGSIAVKPGQDITPRDMLGYVGQSGAVVEPMLALVVSQRGVAYDPFSGHSIEARLACSANADTDNWSDEVNYLEAAIVSAGFAPRVVNHLEVKANAELSARGLTHKSPYLVGWTRVQHIKAGDVEDFELVAPDGTVVEKRHQTLPGDSADYLSFVFVKADKAGLKAGEWNSHYQLSRGGRIIVQKNNSIQLD